MALLDRDVIAKQVVIFGVVFGIMELILIMTDAQVDPIQTARFLAVVALVALVARQTVDLSIGFIIISIAIVGLLAEFVLPGFVTRPFAFVGELFDLTIGFNPGRIDPVSFFVLAVAFTILIIAVRIRVAAEFGDTKGAKGITTIADRVAAQLSRFVDAYANIGRLILLFFAGVVTIFAEQTAMFLGEVGNLIGESPFVVSNVVVALAGYLSLGGSLPIIGSLPLLGDLNAVEFAVVSIIVIGLAVAVISESGGPMARFLRRR